MSNYYGDDVKLPDESSINRKDNMSDSISNGDVKLLPTSTERKHDKETACFPPLAPLLTPFETNNDIDG